MYSSMQSNKWSFSTNIMCSAIDIFLYEKPKPWETDTPVLAKNRPNWK